MRCMKGQNYYAYYFLRVERDLIPIKLKGKYYAYYFLRAERDLTPTS